MSGGRLIDRRTFLQKAGTAGAAVAGSGFSTLSHTFELNQASAAVPSRGGTLRVATVDTPVNMDPQDLELTASIQVYDNIFAKLIELDVNYHYIPALATKWTQNDEKTWTLDLRDDVV